MNTFDKEEADGEAVTSMLGFQSYWDATYADELVNFREHMVKFDAPKSC